MKTGINELAVVGNPYEVLSAQASRQPNGAPELSSWTHFDQSAEYMSARSAYGTEHLICTCKDARCGGAHGQAVYAYPAVIRRAA